MQRQTPLSGTNVNPADSRYPADTVQERDLFPLRDSFFEDIHVKIPFEYAALLEEEYGKKALTLTTYEQ